MRGARRPPVMASGAGGLQARTRERRRREEGTRGGGTHPLPSSIGGEREGVVGTEWRLGDEGEGIRPNGEERRN